MIAITTMKDFEDLLAQSFKGPVLLCKFSPICPNSPIARDEIEAFLKSSTEILTYSIDVVYNRETARTIAKVINVKHESPQVLFFKDGKCIYDEDHFEITTEALKKNILPLITA